MQVTIYVKKIVLYNYGHIIRCGDNSLPVFHS